MDIDPLAVEATQENAALNGLDHLLEVQYVVFICVNSCSLHPRDMVSAAVDHRKSIVDTVIARQIHMHENYRTQTFC